MSLESSIVQLSAMLESLTIEVITLRAAMQTLTATAAVEIEARTDRPMIEVLKFGTAEHAVEAARFPSQKKRRGRPAGIREESPRRVCRARCCGAEHHRRSKDDGKCSQCR